MAKTDKQLTRDPIVRRIIGLLKQHKKTETNLMEYLGLRPGTMSKWKYYGSTLYLKYIDEICEYLDTTPNYLFWGTSDEDRFTQNEKDLIRLYRSLDEGRKQCVRDTMKYFKAGSRKV